MSNDHADPTSRTYGALKDAYAFFNSRLFGDRLPNCLLTVRNHGRSLGYFSSERFGTADGERTHEIALNPRHIISRPLRDTLSTVVHEMVHCQQRQEGKASRNGYHNKEWGRMMKAIGLHPSANGLPGGRETGQKVTHYIIEGGPFDVACAELLATGFELRYGDVTAQGERKEPTRAKFTCPSCGEEAVWGKPGTHVLCGSCEVRMVAQGETPEEVPPIRRLSHWWSKLSDDERDGFICLYLGVSQDDLEDFHVCSNRGALDVDDEDEDEDEVTDISIPPSNVIPFQH